MGWLYVARHRHTGRAAAVKVLNREDAQAVVRFKLEATVAAQVDHPGIVEMLDADFESESNVCFIAMELLVGRTLRAMMDDPASSSAQVIELLTQALAPLAAAHAKGFIHRDLKPENIFVLDPPRETTAVKLLDFGIAAQQEGVDRMTRTGTAMGTPHYMSPEQAVNARSAGPASDVWSMGVMMYEAIRGQVPFSGESVHAVIVQACTREHEPLDTVVPDLDPGLARLVDRCLSKEAARRPADASELLTQLRALKAPASMPDTRTRRSAANTSPAAAGMRRRIEPVAGASGPLAGAPRKALLGAGLILLAAIVTLGATGAIAQSAVLALTLLACTSTLLGALALRPLRARANGAIASRVPAGGMPRSRPAEAKNDVPGPPTAEIPTVALPLLGPDTAGVRIDLFLDLTCHASRKAAQRVMQLRNEHAEDIQIAFRPLPQPGREQSWGAVEVMCAALERGGPGAFWAVFDGVLSSARKVTARVVEELAISVGLEPHDLGRALRARTFQRVAIQCRQQAIALGVAHSPTLFINGVQWSGELNEETLRWKFFDALAESKRRSVNPGLISTQAPEPESPPPSITLRGVLIRYEGARNAPRGLRRTRAQARMRAEKLTARAMMPEADFAALGQRFGDHLLEPETTQPRADDALSLAVSRLGVNEVCSPIECDEGFYVAQRIA
jgi:predicted DsbA family dithiol-disulfide isomerase